MRVKKAKGKRLIAGFLSLLMCVTLLPVNTLSITYAEEPDSIVAEDEEEQAADSDAVINEDISEENEEESDSTAAEDEEDSDTVVDEDIPQENEEDSDNTIAADEEEQEEDSDAAIDEDIPQVDEEESLEDTEPEISLASDEEVSTAVGFTEGGRPTLSISGDKAISLDYPKPGDTLTVKYTLDQEGEDTSIVRWCKVGSDGKSRLFPEGFRYCECGEKFPLWYQMSEEDKATFKEVWYAHLREHAEKGENARWTDMGSNTDKGSSTDKAGSTDKNGSTDKAGSTVKSESCTIPDYLIGYAIIVEVIPNIEGEDFSAGTAVETAPTGVVVGADFAFLEFTQEPELSIAQGTSNVDNPALAAPREGNVLTVDYTLDLAQGASDASTITWYRIKEDAADTIIKTDTVTVDGIKSYTVTGDDNGYRIKAEVAPKESEGRPGVAKSAETGMVIEDNLEFTTAPALSSTGSVEAPETGDVLTVSYDLPIGEGESDHSTIRWYSDGDEITVSADSKNYIVTDDDLYKVITVAVTPYISATKYGKTVTLATGTVQLKYYSVYYDLRGHGGGIVMSGLVPSGCTISKPADPTDPDYTFTGWYKDAGCKEKWNFEEDTVNADITLYAGWKIKDRVSAPTASIASGSVVEAGEEVSLSTATAGAKIYYTTDRLQLAKDGILYEDVIVIDNDIAIDNTITIWAVAVKDGYRNSQTAEFIYTVKDESLNWGDLTEEDRQLYNTPGDIPDHLWIAGIPDNTDYTGKTVTFDVRVYDHKKLLTNKSDYTIAYKNNTNAADKGKVAASKAPTVKVTGKGNYSGSIVTYFTINPINISINSSYADEFAVEDVLRAYTGKVQKTASVLKRNGKALKSGKDYTISYDAASQTKRVYQDAGIYPVTVMGKGNYTGTRVYYETIAEETLMSKVSVTSIKNQKYTGSEVTPELNVTYSKQPLTGMGASEYAEASEEERLAVDYTYVFTNNKEIGTASVTLTGVNKYIGTVTKNFKITGTALKDCTLTGFEKTCAYTGKAVWQSVSLRYSSGTGSSKITHELVGMPASNYERENDVAKASVDYIFEYLNNTEVGTATVIYTGINGYTGTIKKSYKITGISMGNVKVDGFQASFVYTGEEIGQDTARLSYSTGRGADQITLEEDKDYTVTYQNNVKAGTAAVIYKGIGKYAGTIKKTYKITAYNLKDDVDKRIEVTYSDSAVYAKGGATPVPVVTYNYKGKSTILTAGTDYTVSYANHTAASENSGKTPYIFIQGKGSFSGKCQAGSFTITKQNLKELVITVPDITYKNKANIYKAVPVLTDLNGKKLVSGTDYEKTFAYVYVEDTEVTQLIKKESVPVKRRKGEAVSPSDIIPVGTEIEITATGKNNYEGTISAVFRFVEGNISGASVSVAAQYYTGKSLRPGKDQITIKLGKTVLSAEDYKIVSYANNVKKGTARLTLCGIGNYGGTKTVNFKIVDRTMGCLVRFDGNGATGGKMNNQIIASNIIGNPLAGNQYKRTGYRFVGWNTEKDGSGTQYKNKERFRNGYRKYGVSVTLYAQWEIER